MSYNNLFTFEKRNSKARRSLKVLNLYSHHGGFFFRSLPLNICYLYLYINRKTAE